MSSREAIPVPSMQRVDDEAGAVLHDHRALAAVLDEPAAAFAVSWQ